MKILKQDSLEYILCGNQAIVVDCDKLGGKVIIPQYVRSDGNTYEVTHICRRAFFRAIIDSVIIPNLRNGISQDAFDEAYLKKVEFLTKIPVAKGAFKNCPTIRRVAAPKNWKELKEAFYPPLPPDVYV